MAEPLIPGGCILIARKIIDSAIWEKPPLYMKVWVYLLVKAQHSDYKKLKRGQLVTSIPEIMDDVSWKVGARRERPTKDQVFQIIDWLRNTSSKATLHGYEGNARATTEAPSKAAAKATMITTTKATQKILINISNYSDYQELRSYESNARSNDESNIESNDESIGEKATAKPASASEPDNINKNLRSFNKNNKDNIYTIFEFWNSKKIITHRELTDTVKSAVNARLQVHSEGDLLTAIDNYHTCLIGPEYYYSHKFTLKEFMNPKNIDKFLTENSPFDNFKDRSKKGNKQNDIHQMARELEDEMNGSKRN
jgi:hypothetical protein